MTPMSSTNLPTAVLRCPVCAAPLDDQGLWTCRVCETPHHTECHEYVGGCSRFACSEAATPRRRLAELLRLVTNQEMLEHGGLALGFFVVGIVFYPLLLVALFEAVRVLILGIRRHRLAQHLTQPQLVDHLRTILVSRPLILYQGKTEPKRPSLIVTGLAACTTASVLSHLLLVVFVKTMRPWDITPDLILKFQIWGQILAAAWLTMFYPRYWLEWKQSMMLHQAGRVFRIWREELEPLLALRASKTQLLKPGTGKQ